MQAAIILLLAALTLSSTFAQQPAPAADSHATIQSTSQEVVLDVVIRDKKGRIVKDLAPNEISITEDGVQQKINSFRFVEGSTLSTSAAGAPVTPNTAPATAAPRGTSDPLRQVRMLTMVFDRLGTEGRLLSRSASYDLLKNETGANVYFGVFTIDQKVSLLQQYTTDKEAVKKAVTRATSANYSLYTDEADRIQQELTVEAASDTANSTSSSSAQGPAAAEVSQAFAQVTLNMLQFAQAMERTQQSRASVFSLLSIIKEQGRLPGRKTVLYFTEGLLVNPELEDQFRSIISIANRANVSVYAVDAKGLVTYNMNSSSTSMLNQATASSRSQQKTGLGPAPVRPDQAKALDLAESATRGNTQNKLAELSQETGGVFIANTNDLRPQLRRVTEDLNSYYELAYQPHIERFDGTFRKISVKLARSDLRAQTRSGYFALPYVAGQNVVPYEVPMLGALSSTPVPRNIPFRSAALHYQNGPSASSAVVIDVPMSGITFNRDETAQLYKAHLSILALYKDTSGNIVRKFSQDVPAQGPLEKVAAFQAGHFIYTQHTDLPPGRYTLETAVLDRETLKVAGKRMAVIVPTVPQSISISSLSFVRDVSAPSPHNDPADFFDSGTAKVEPGLDDTVKGGAGAKLPLYFVVYPQAGATDAPKLSLEFLQDDKVVARGDPQLPAVDSRGQISYMATSPIDTFKPGLYEIRATVSQSGKAAREHAYFTVE